MFNRITAKRYGFKLHRRTVNGIVGSAPIIGSLKPYPSSPLSNTGTLCHRPTTVGGTADGNGWSTVGTLNTGTWAGTGNALGWATLPVMSPLPPLAMGATVGLMGSHRVRLRTLLNVHVTYTRAKRTSCADTRAGEHALLSQYGHAARDVRCDATSPLWPLRLQLLPLTRIPPGLPATAHLQRGDNASPLSEMWAANDTRKSCVNGNRRGHLTPEYRQLSSERTPALTAASPDRLIGAVRAQPKAAWQGRCV